MRYALLFVANLGCKGSDEKAAPKPAEKAAAAEPAPATAPAAAAAKSEYKPDELWTKVSGLDRTDLLELSNAGVTVTGTVQAIKDDPTGEYTVELDAGNKHVVALTYGDFGKAAKAKKIKVGDTIAASKCEVTVPAGDHLFAVQCEVK